MNAQLPPRPSHSSLGSLGRTNNDPMADSASTPTRWKLRSMNNLTTNQPHSASDSNENTPAPNTGWKPLFRSATSLQNSNHETIDEELTMNHQAPTSSWKPLSRLFNRNSEKLDLDEQQPQEKPGGGLGPRIYSTPLLVPHQSPKKAAPSQEKFALQRRSSMGVMTATNNRYGPTPPVYSNNDDKPEDAMKNFMNVMKKQQQRQKNGGAAIVSDTQYNAIIQRQAGLETKRHGQKANDKKNLFEQMDAMRFQKQKIMEENDGWVQMDPRVTQVPTKKGNDATSPSYPMEDQSRIDEIIELKLQKVQQQAIIDTLSTKLHNLEHEFLSLGRAVGIDPKKLQLVLDGKIRDLTGENSKSDRSFHAKAPKENGLAEKKKKKKKKSKESNLRQDDDHGRAMDMSEDKNGGPMRESWQLNSNHDVATVHNEEVKLLAGKNGNLMNENQRLKRELELLKNSFSIANQRRSKRGVSGSTGANSSWGDLAASRLSVPTSLGSKVAMSPVDLPRNNSFGWY